MPRKPRKDYTPTAVSDVVNKIIESHTERTYRSPFPRRSRGLPDGTCRPPFHSWRNDGLYQVTVQPPGKEPVKFSIPGSQLQEADACRCCCCDTSSGGSSISELDVKFVSKKGGVKDEATQYSESDIPKTKCKRKVTGASKDGCVAMSVGEDNSVDKVDLKELRLLLKRRPCKLKLENRSVLNKSPSMSPVKDSDDIVTAVKKYARSSWK